MGRHFNQLSHAARADRALWKTKEELFSNKRGYRVREAKCHVGSWIGARTGEVITLGDIAVTARKLEHEVYVR